MASTMPITPTGHRFIMGASGPARGALS